MMKYSIFKLTTIFCLLSFMHSNAQSIEEKLSMFDKQALSSEPSNQVSEKIRKLKEDLKELYLDIDHLIEKKASKEFLQGHLQKIKKTRALIAHTEMEWKLSHPSPLEEEPFSFLNEEDSTLFNVILEYGCHDTLYIIPNDIRSIPIHLASQVPIPKESWDEVLSIILAENGVGVEEISPFVKKLYIGQDSFDGVHLFQDDPELICSMPSDKRVGYFLKVPSDKVDPILSIINKFYSPLKTSFYPFDRSILIISQVSEVKKIIQLARFITDAQSDTDFIIESPQQASASSIKEILNGYFENKSKTFGCHVIEGGKNLLFIKGTKDEIRQVRTIYDNLKTHLTDNQENTVYCYTSKNTEASALAEVLEKCYPLILSKGIKDKPGPNTPPMGIYQNNPAKEHSHFIVDSKTDTLIMIVSSHTLPTLLQLLKKIDIPKKMVHLEVLFFEKRIKESNNVGLNQLSIGANAGTLGGNGVSWKVDGGAAGSTPLGIFDFFLSKGKHKGIPAYDLTYQFLISQEDIQIHSCPTVTTVNQTPAVVRLVDEISINTGVVAFGNTNDSNNTYLKDSYAREEFGVILEITPTINEKSENSKSFVTLKTNISFESNNSRPSNPRPDITKRKIENEVRIANGESIVVGGLRKKLTSSAKDSIPFLGSIPGIGKMFSHNEESDGSTEMFICITPKIIESEYTIRQEAMTKVLNTRPGDSEEFLSCLNESMERESQQKVLKALDTVFRESEITCDGEYDGG